MEAYQIIWTFRATKDLKKVYSFYTQIIGEKKAFDLILLLLERVDQLSDIRFVKIWPTDEEIESQSRDYRKLIEGDIKITYRLSTSKPIVYINRIFDTRQNPLKNK